MVVPFFCHVYVNPVPVFALRSTLPPAQNVVGPAGVMVAPGPGVEITYAVADVS